MLFISPKILFLFSRYLNFCSDFFDQVEKLVDKKDKVNFKTCDKINWEADT